MASRTDVVIVGAGLSGLSAAKLLRDNGIDVIVLEANDRVGGRLYSIQNDSVGFADLGGAYIGPTQDRVIRMAKELGVKTNDVYSRDSMICYRKGKIIKYTGALPPMGSIKDMMDNAYLLRRTHELCEQVKLDKPWESPDAEALDRISYQEWLEKLIDSETVKDSARMLLRINMTGEPYEVSLLWTLWYTKGAGGVHRMNGLEGGAQEKNFIDGAQQLPIRLAEKLAGSVFTNRPVAKIRQDKEKVTVYTVNGEEYEAKHVILATAPVMQSGIVYDPPLPALRNQFIQRTPQGSVIKTVTYYDRPYWRDHGLSGTTVVEDDDHDLPVTGTIDDTKGDGRYPALVGFIVGDKARMMSRLTKEERRAMIAQQYAKIFDIPELASPIHYEDKNWCDDPWVGGCYTAIMGPGIWTSYGSVIRKPIGRLHFAGTETATKWSGYMDGAIDAGERAAREILFTFGKCKKEEIFQEEITDLDGELQLNIAQKMIPSSKALVSSLKTVGVAVAAGVAGKYLWSKL